MDPQQQDLNADKTEENDLKINIMKIIEAVKEEMKNSVKDMEEKTARKYERN